jgi:hypothetical protein
MSPFRSLLSFAAAAGCILLLAGCETTGTGPLAASAPPQPPQPPMTRTRAASECWMETEKSNPSMNLDKRADLVDRCIDKKLKHG